MAYHYHMQQSVLIQRHPDICPTTVVFFERAGLIFLIETHWELHFPQIGHSKYRQFNVSWVTVNVSWVPQ